MINIILYLSSLCILIVLHELAHIIVANRLGLPLVAIGINMKPIPHPFVAIDKREATPAKLLIYLLAPSFCTLLLGAIAFNTLKYPIAVFMAWGSMSLIETNPYYSDYTLAYSQILSNKGNYIYSLPWFSHFFSWIIVGLGIVKWGQYLYF